MKSSTTQRSFFRGQTLNLGHLFISAGFLFWLTSAPAQTLSGGKLAAAPVEEVAVDDAVPESLRAVPQVEADAVPTTGTFQSGQHADDWPPLPANLNNLPCWDLGGGIFLVNDFSFDYETVSVEAQMKPIAKGGGGMMTMGIPDFPPDDGGTNSGGGGGTYYVPYNTNLLWLELTNVVGQVANVNLHHGTNQVYGIWGTTNLPGNWLVETEVWPTNADCMPFTVPMLNRTNLFLRAQDWTGVDSNGDGVPDWWLWKYFGTLALNATNLDAAGHTLGYDYTNSVVPITYIYYGVDVTNSYVGSGSASVQLNLTGQPYYFAVLVDDTNYADAVWQNYATTNVTVSLGAIQGWHDVWIGLRGHADTTNAATWQWQRLKLDTTPPALVITGPTNSTVARPVIQLTGYSPEALQSLSYDLTNATGLVTNQQMLVTGQYYDLNTTEFTTNYFQAYDVALTNGVNTFTLHVTDLAGNVTTLTTNFTVDYTGLTNPPVVQVSWPKTGAYLSGNSFNVSGQVADPTVTVSAQLVDTNSVTNVVAGVVGRDGQFWVQNLPLHSGTNTVALSAQDVLGHTTTTNLTLIQSAVTVTIDPVVAGQVTVTGTVSASGYSVLVNGVAATVSGTNWSAQIAPVTIGGGTVAAIAVAGAGPTNQTQTLVTPPQGVYMQTYNLHDYWHFYFPPLAGGGTNVIETKIDWTNGVGGQGYYYWKNDFATWDNDQYFWPTVLWPQWQSPGPTLWQWNSSTTNWDVTTNATTLNSYLQGEHCDMSSSVLGAPFTTQRRTADAEYELATGGPLGSTNLNLWVLSATARAYTNAQDSVGVAVPPNQIALGNFGNLDTNGNLYVVLPDNDPDVITPRVPGKDKYSFTVGAQKYTLLSYTQHPALANTNRDRTTIGVGEEVNLSGMPTNTIWNVSTGSLAYTTGSNNVLTAPSNAATATVTASAGGKAVAIPFKVLEPIGYGRAQIIGTNHFSFGTAGVAMTNAIWITPTNVSFYRVSIMEVGEDATNISGYFTLWTPLQLRHTTADHWAVLNADNQFQDWAGHFSFPPPWSTGSFMWNIPARWQVTGSGVTNTMSGWNQIASIDASGTMTVQKFGRSTTRTTNDVITTY